jgi:hypothetical protein
LVIWLHNEALRTEEMLHNCCPFEVQGKAWTSMVQVWLNGTFLTIQATKQYSHVLHILTLQTPSK